MARHPKQRSAVTNGSRIFLEAVPGNSETARRFKDLLNAAEIERGGSEAMTAPQRTAARAWAGLAVLLEQMHTDIARGIRVDSERLGQLGDRMDRQSRRMGPVKAPVPKDIRSHLALRRQA